MPELEEISVSVWRKVLVDGAKYVDIDGEKYPVRETAKRRLNRLTSDSKIMNFAASNRILIPNQNGRRWRVTARSVC
jgi:hypothetical protein